MRTALTKAEAPSGDRSQLPTKACYLLRVEPGKGLQWVANGKSEWRLPDGHPALREIAAAAGVTFQHMFKLRRAPAQAPGNRTMAALVKIAAEAHSVPRETAAARIFWFFDPENPRDIERLTGYLQPIESELPAERCAA